MGANQEMNSLLSATRRIPSTNFRNYICKEAEKLVTICFRRQMAELRDFTTSSAANINDLLTENTDIVSREIISMYAQLKPFLENQASHTQIIKAWMTFILHDANRPNDMAVVTSVQPYTKLQSIFDYCNRSLDGLAAFLSGIENLQEKCERHKDNGMFYQELEFLNKRHSERIKEMTEEMRENFIHLTHLACVILNLTQT
ncbi:hypothetical protein Ahia01_001103900 [Argonauta hians]